jgi:hypothetical protein
MNEGTPWSDLAVLLRDVAEAEDQAAHAFAATLELVSGQVAVRWADPLPPAAGPGGRPVSHLPVFDVRYPAARGEAAPDTRWAGASFEWSFGISELRDDRPGEVAFGAGVTVPIAAEGSLLDDPQWIAGRRGEGFEHLHNVRLSAAQLMRWLHVDTVLAAGEIADQADFVADWIVATFEKLAASPPGRAG